jgi:hypothetical protein
MKKIFIILLAQLVFFSCKETDVNVSQPQYSKRVSIQCALEVGKNPELFFYSTLPFFEAASLKDAFLDSSIVKISNSFETDSLSKDSTFNYLKCEYEYFYEGKIPIKANEEYMLEILFKGNKYTANTKTNLTRVIIDSVRYIKAFTDIYGEHEGVIPYFKDIANETDFYRYQMIRPVDTTMKYREGKIYSSCIGNKTVTITELGRSVYSDDNINGEQFSMVIEPAYSHRKGLSTYVQIQTIDKNSYDFYYQLDKQKLGQLNPFVEPYFLKDGQFGHAAVGFFGTVLKSDSVLFVFPE